MNVYRGGIVAIGAAFVVIGIAMLVVTALNADGFAVGYLLGPCFVALGVGRLYLALRRRG